MINGGACASSYEEETAVTLAATAATGSEFGGWSGGGCSGTGTCVIASINADTTVIAMFSASEGSEEGSLKVGSSASVNGSTALLTISCQGPGDCQGILKLTAKIDGKSVVIGTAAYDVGAGKSKTLKLKLSAAGKKALKKAKGHKLKVKVKVTYTPTGGSASAITKTVIFKVKGKKK